MLRLTRCAPLLLLALLLGCHSADLQPRVQATSAAVADPAAAGIPCSADDAHLFPTAALQQREGWYGKHLRAADEGRLCSLPPGTTEAYRFIWLRTFHPPIIVRVEQREDTHVLIAKQLDGAGGYEPGRMVVNRTVPLRPEQWVRLRALLDSAAFWSPSGRSRDTSPGLDGAQWVLEGVREGHYRAFDYWTPGDTGPERHVRRVGLHLLRLADLLPGEAQEIY
jgi:hypothetical protein